MRSMLVALSVLLAFPALAALDGPASTPTSCPLVLVTDHVYRWSGDDLFVPAGMLPRLSVTLQQKGVWGWRKPVRVELRFDGNVLATFGYSDRDALDANRALEARYGQYDRWTSRVHDVIRDTALAWKLEIARARLSHSTLKLRFRSGEMEYPEELLYSTQSSVKLTVASGEVPNLDVTWISAAERNSGPTVLLRHRKTPIFAVRLGSHWEVDGKLKQLRADLAYATAKGLPLTIRQTKSFPLTFDVDAPAK